jgi:hypothetical protein
MLRLLGFAEIYNDAWESEPFTRTSDIGISANIGEFPLRSTPSYAPA